ncbi:MAG: prepilin-type N-terminal cleavage/methylation domain-containing protein [Candidatus Omnitrophica bacterium]|nr:prepilin-type N-terminal cleavage/methylation domain-containing protein [Candidatus Omnitrophota bacterium]
MFYLKPKTKRSFTLIEVMLSTVVLALGIVVIYESFFRSLDLFGYYNNYLNVASSADEIIWNAQNELNLFGPTAVFANKGVISQNNKDFNWNLFYESINPENNLYKIDLFFSWKEGSKDVKLLRTEYAVYTKKD